MSDYKKMYLTLVDEISNTIDNLKGALEKAENIYIDTAEPVDEANDNDDNKKTATE